MVWLWRGLAAVGAILVLLAVSVAVAFGPQRVEAGQAPAAMPSGSVGGPSAPSPMPVPTTPIPVPQMDPFEGLPDPGAPVEERPTAVFLGDSITMGDTPMETGLFDEHSWFYGLVDDSTGILKFGGKVADIGMTTAWMAEHAQDAVASQPDILILHGGTNDISGAVPIPEILLNYVLIKQVADEAGIPLAVCTLPPQKDPTANAEVMAFNLALVDWAGRNGVRVLDTAAAVRGPDGNWIEGYSNDGLHPTAEAAALMARAAADALRGVPQGVYSPQP